MMFIFTFPLQTDASFSPFHYPCLLTPTFLPIWSKLIEQAEKFRVARISVASINL